MAQVITFENFTPIPRYDSIAWEEVRIEEGETADGPWVELETQTLTPVDADPAEPAERNFTTELASDEADLWYRLIFVDGTGDESLPSIPIQNVSDESSYTTVDELARILKIRTPTDAQQSAMRRVLASAAGEINSEIDLAEDVTLAGWQLALAAEVNLERAVEHWHQQESPFGLYGQEGLEGLAPTGRNSWERHALKLAPLKSQWGIA